MRLMPPGVRFIAWSLLVLLGIVGSSYAHAPPPCNDNPCVIEHDGGGSIVQYEKLAVRLVRTKERLEIAGPCFSACTILADHARPFVCIRPGAEFHIHQAMMSGGPLAGLRTPVRYSTDLHAWIENRGGQPTVGWLSMDYVTALLFWPACPDLVT
jgi:hypothetical protein